LNERGAAFVAIGMGLVAFGLMDIDTAHPVPAQQALQHPSECFDLIDTGLGHQAPARHGFDAPNLKIVKNGSNGGLKLR